MNRYGLCALALLVLASSTSAQDRFEVQPFGGYKFGGVVPVGQNVFGFNSVEFKNTTSYGATFGINLSEHFGVEFLYNRQPTQAIGLTPTGPDPQRVDVNLDQFHGNILLHFRDGDAKLRPFLLMGAGATRGSGAGSSETRFSFGLGGGLKYFFTPNFGLRFQARYAPTYLYSKPGGLWCDWWGFCWAVPNDVYIQQGDATVGFVFRF